MAGGSLVLAAHAAVILPGVAVPLLLIGSVVEPREGRADAWSRAFADADRWIALLGTSTIVSVTAAAVALAIGVPLAALTFRSGGHASRTGRAALAGGALLPYFVPQAAWIAVLGAESIRGSAWALGLVHGVSAAPMAALIVGVTLRHVPRDVEGAALLDGWSVLAVLARVTLPAAWRGIALAAAVTAWLAATDFFASDLLLVRTFAEEVYTEFALYRDARVPTLLLLPTFAIFAAIAVVLGRRVLARSHVTELRPLPLELGRWRFPALALASLLVGLPIAWLLMKVGATRGLLDHARVFGSGILTSIGTSLAAGALCAGAAVGAAWRLARGCRFERLALFAWLATGLALPAPLLGIGLIALLDALPDIGLRESPVVLVVAYVLRFLPVAVLIVLPGLRGTPRDIEDAARLDGASSLTIWARVVCPLSARSAIVAGLVVTALSLAEVPASTLIVPPGYATMATSFFQQIHYGLAGEAAALCILTTTLAAVPVGFALWFALLRPEARI